MKNKIYHVDASAGVENSISRNLTQYIVNKINRQNNFNVTKRDVGKADGLAFLDDTSVSGLFIDESERSTLQTKALEYSERIVKEAFENDIWVIGLPIYNFSAPATFKTWADMLARSNMTFKYVNGKPVGLLKNKCVFVVIISGGTEMDSEVDFCTPWLRQFMSFIGIDNLNIINATRHSHEKKSKFLKDINMSLKHNGF